MFKLIKNEIPIYCSFEILNEYEKVLKRDFEYPEEEINRIVKVLMKFLIIVFPEEKIEVVKEDSEDNKIIECAIESNSNYILTYDKHLLKIESFRDIKIVKPEQFLLTS